MRIGIDIDDTIINTWEYFMPMFSEKFNISIDEIKKLPPYYGAIKDLISINEFYNLMKEYEELIYNVSLKENVSKIITKLKEEGHTIIFITARSDNSYTNPYLISKKYLDNNSIPYDKIIVNAREKGPICKEEKIDLFIDDNFKNCTDVSNQGIEVLMMDAIFNKEAQGFTRVNNWQEVYEYIKNR